MSRKSNREICNLYMQKNRDEVTQKYFKTWKAGKNKKNNAYLGLYEDFENFSVDSKNIDACENKDNVSLYRVLQAWKEPEKASFPIEIYNTKCEKIGEIPQTPENGEFVLVFENPELKPKKFHLDFLENIDIDILNPARNPGGKANQKWHLYVSYFACSVVCNNKFDWSKSSIGRVRCTPLRLWMIENTEGQEAALREIEEVIDRGGRVTTLVKVAFNDITAGI